MNLQEAYSQAMREAWTYDGIPLGWEPALDALAETVYEDIMNNRSWHVFDKDHKPITYRLTQNPDADDPEIGHEWATLCGEKMVVKEADGHKSLLLNEGHLEEDLADLIAGIVGDRKPSEKNPTAVDLGRILTTGKANEALLLPKTEGEGTDAGVDEPHPQV